MTGRITRTIDELERQAYIEGDVALAELLREKDVDETTAAYRAGYDEGYAQGIEDTEKEEES